MPGGYHDMRLSELISMLELLQSILQKVSANSFTIVDDGKIYEV